MKNRAFINRNIIALIRRRYTKVEKRCFDRLDTDPNDYAAHYTLGMSAYYQKDPERSFRHFLNAARQQRLGKRSERWVVRNLLEHDLYVNRRFAVVENRATQLESLLSDHRARVLNGRYLVASLYQQNKYEECLAKLNSLSEEIHEDDTTKRIRHEIVQSLRR